MWSWADAIKNDLQEFAHVVAGDTTQIISTAVGAVSGESDRDDDDVGVEKDASLGRIVAGDEDLPESALSKAPRHRIRQLQLDDETFIVPLAEAEAYRFNQWIHADRAGDQTWQAALLTNSVELRHQFSSLVENEQRVDRQVFFERYLARLHQLRVACAKRSVLKKNDTTIKTGEPQPRQKFDDGLAGWDDDDDDKGSHDAAAPSTSTAVGSVGDAAAEIARLRQANAALVNENVRLTAEVASLNRRLRDALAASSNAVVTQGGEGDSGSRIVQQAKVAETSAVVVEPPKPSALAPLASPPVPAEKDDDDDWTNLA